MQNDIRMLKNTQLVKVILGFGRFSNIEPAMYGNGDK